MTNDIFQSAQDATLLSLEEKEGLIPSHIMSRGELNRSEQANILVAEEWVFKRDRDVTQIDFFLHCINACLDGSGTGPDDSENQEKILGSMRIVSLAS